MSTSTSPELGNCVHHWILESDNSGSCCRCGATRVFLGLKANWAQHTQGTRQLTPAERKIARKARKELMDLESYAAWQIREIR